MRILSFRPLIYSIIYISVFFCPIAGSGQSVAETDYLPADSVEVERLLRSAPASANPLWYARQFLGRPYVAHTLEKGPSEPLTVNLRGLDCTTLVETVSALYLCRRQERFTFADYKATLQNLRYFDGHRQGYLSRLHYFAWWVRDNELRHNIVRVADNAHFTAHLRIDNHYMSTHPQAYPLLANDTLAVSQIRSLEKAYNGDGGPYLPAVATGLSRKELATIQDGDIIAIVTSRDGLDYAHLGFAQWGKDGKLHMLHASSLRKRVISDPLPLREYLRKHPSFSGIAVFRLQPAVVSTQ